MTEVKFLKHFSIAFDGKFVSSFRMGEIYSVSDIQLEKLIEHESVELVVKKIIEPTERKIVEPTIKKAKSKK